MMDKKAISLAAVLLTACTATDDPPPTAGEPYPRASVSGGTWRSNAEGFVYATGFYTPEQVESSEWENARRKAARLAKFCDNPRMVRRDIRWFLPIAANEPRCARIIYSYACPVRRPEWGSSLSDTRDEVFLSEPPSRISTNCGSINDDSLTGKGDAFGAPRNVKLHDRATCKKRADIAKGQFRLKPINYFYAQTFVSPSYVRKVRGPYPSNPMLFPVNLASNASTLFVQGPSHLEHDPVNIFVNMIFAANGDGYCVIFEARQGSSEWRQTIYRDSIPRNEKSERLVDGHSPFPDRYWDQYSDAHLLEHAFAEHIGLKIPQGHGLSD